MTKCTLTPSVLTALLLCLTTTSVASAHDDHAVVRFDVETLSPQVAVPKPLSDFTAVLVGDKVYLTGGCDADNGNVWTEEGYRCSSVSTAQFVFDLTTRTFDDESASMPEPRYRHGAAAVNNQIWLVGGRDKDGMLVSNVDVYDIVTDTWTTYPGPSSNVTHVSDLAAFGNPLDQSVHFVAGYSEFYDAQTAHSSIDTVSTTGTGLLVVNEKAPLPTARGDVGAIATQTEDGKEYALVVGGFTPANEWCAPLATTERYDFATDTWTTVADLLQERGDKALVVLENRVYALGGERQIANICELDVEVDPGEETVPINDVEWYNVETDEWEFIEDLPRHRFRFSAVGWNEAIYAFGGQLAFDDSCQCFKATEEVTVYTEEKESHSEDSTSGAWGVSVVGALSVVAVVFF